MSETADFIGGPAHGEQFEVPGLPPICDLPSPPPIMAYTRLEASVRFPRERYYRRERDGQPVYVHESLDDDAPPVPRCPA